MKTIEQRVDDAPRTGLVKFKKATLTNYADGSYRIDMDYSDLRNVLIKAFEDYAKELKDPIQCAECGLKTSPDNILCHDCLCKREGK